MISLEPKSIPISHSVPPLDTLKLKDVSPQILSAKVEINPEPIYKFKTTKGLGKNLAPEARRLILEIKERAC